MSENKNLTRDRRLIRTRAKISSMTNRISRLVVSRSLKHIYAQIIDDINSSTLVFANDQEIKHESNTKKQEIAREVGKLIGQKALKKGITRVVFDRRYYKYHGNIKAVCEGARESGLTV